ncbi:hypothetical protein [Thalassotalea sp. PLHSN55]|uniref:hypothetical protein n=1 Tax=Thalassotalea sp. PLHSN55 TaxID=3435888 RepID=UPI003F86552F
MDENKLKVLKYDIDAIIRNGSTGDSKNDMIVLADYYQYLSDKIMPYNFSIDAPEEFLLCFESLYLWLHEKLTLLSPSIKTQIEDIFTNKNLCEIFAILSSISPKDIYRFNRSKSFGVFGSIFAPKLDIKFNDQQAELVSSRNILDTKVALTRLAQVVRFSASKISDVSFGSSSFEEFKSSYDPDLINKAKMSALVGILKSQISDLPQDQNTSLLLEKLDEIESEVKKSKPHWGLIFSTLFVIFGFTADLKTLNPDVYTKPLQTIENILFSAHDEGKVEKNKASIKLLSDSPSQPFSQKQNDEVVVNSRKEDELEEAET